MCDPNMSSPCRGSEAIVVLDPRENLSSACRHFGSIFVALTRYLLQLRKLQDSAAMLEKALTEERDRLMESEKECAVLREECSNLVMTKEDERKAALGVREQDRRAMASLKERAEHAEKKVCETCACGD
jgi:hypothetical protein